MANAIDFTVELIDKISGPAEFAAAAIKRLTGQIKDAGGAAAKQAKAARETSRAMGFLDVAFKVTSIALYSAQLIQLLGGLDALKSGARKAAGAVGAAFRNIGPMLKKALPFAVVGGGGFLAFKGAGAALGAITSVIGGLTIGAGIAGIAIGALAAKIGIDFARALGKGIIAAASFRESALRGLEIITGSANMAGATFESSMKLADRLGTNARDTITAVQRLMAKGFDVGGAQDVFKALADLKVVIPTANLDNAVLAIEQIKAKGVLSMEELQGQLAEAGLDVGKVLEAIGQNMGKTSKEVRALISEGKVSADAGILGILQSIKNLTGKELGETAEKASMGIHPLLDRFADLPQRFFDEVVKTLDASGFGDVLKDVWESIGPGSDAFKGAVAAVDRIVSAFSLLFDAISGGDVKGSVQGFGDVVITILNAIADAILFVHDHWESISTVLKGFAFSLAVVIGQIIAFGVLIGGALALVAGIVGKIINLGPSLHEAGVGLGNSLVQGIANGVSGMIGVVVQAMRNLANTVLATAKSVLGIASPSKVFAEMGSNLTAGMAIGMETEAPMLRGSAASIGLAAAGGAMAGAAAGGGGSASNVFLLTVQAPTGGTREDGQRYGEGILDTLRRGLPGVLDGAAVSAGA